MTTPQHPVITRRRSARTPAGGYSLCSIVTTSAPAAATVSLTSRQTASCEGVRTDGPLTNPCVPGSLRRTSRGTSGPLNTPFSPRSTVISSGAPRRPARGRPRAEVRTLQVGALEIRTDERRRVRETVGEQLLEVAGGLVAQDAGDDAQRVSRVGRTGDAELRLFVEEPPQPDPCGEPLDLVPRRQRFHDGLERSTDHRDAVALRPVAEVAQQTEDGAQETDERRRAGDPPPSGLSQHRRERTDEAPASPGDRRPTWRGATRTAAGARRPCGPSRSSPRPPPGTRPGRSPPPARWLRPSRRRPCTGTR